MVLEVAVPRFDSAEGLNLLPKVGQTEAMAEVLAAAYLRNLVKAARLAEGSVDQTQVVVEALAA